MKAVVLDIGGTAVKSAIFENGSLGRVRETPAASRLGGPHLMEQSVSLIESYRQTDSFERIGISTAGQVDPVSGRIIYANENIPNYTGTPIRELLEKQFSLPVAVENDVNAAALGEAVYGAGKGLTDFACLTYGTGVGGALYLGGRLYHGSSCSAGEFGAIVVHPEDRDPAADAFSGCYERYASATALVRKTRLLDPSLSNGRAVFARIDEPAVCSLVDEWIREIVYGLTTITHMLNPSALILGGGVMEQPYVTERLAALFYPQIMESYRHVRLLGASLGNRAGMIGAGVLASSLPNVSSV